ncbi:AraC family transcriptional regulator [Streptomyces sp. NPDC004111]|uniref:AraC family transcriptional regulator n=1 Tax=Streptomyces sp. NPDC004111 TaxID=3364690 RepID=UPI0036862FC7
MNPKPAAGDTSGFLSVRTFRGRAPSVVRAPGNDVPGPHLTLGLLSLGRAELVGPGTAVPCLPGDLFVRDGTAPFALHTQGAPHGHATYELHLVRIERRALGLTDAQAGALGDRSPFRGGPVAPLLGPLVAQLARTSPERPSAESLGLATSIAELVPLLAVDDSQGTPSGAAARAGGSPAQDREDLVRRLCAHIDAHLWDRNLTPASVAAAQHISIRYLHKLFEGHGRTIGRWIQHRRLEEARRELARPGRADITVSAVARRWGFASPTHFSRSFRAVYGMSPSDWRDCRVAPADAARADAA